VLAKVVTDILNDRLRLRDYDVFLRASGPDTDGRRFSKRMNSPQFGSGAFVLIALVALDVVFEIQLFEQPDDALTTRLVEPVIVSGLDTKVMVTV
jgi:hypothetical protein